MKPLTLDEVNEKIANKPVILLGNYVNRTVKTEWQCKVCSYIWKATLACVQASRKGCPKCVGKHYKLIDIQKIARLRKFQLLSTKFTGMTGKYEWKCPDGHTWKATGSHIRNGTGCPYCNSYITEEACRFIFQEFTGFHFKKNRSILEARLELDGYCHELEMAF